MILNEQIIMFCTWGSETQLHPLGQLSEMCPNCNRSTIFTCFELIERDHICAIPCGSNSKGKFAQCNVCGIRFTLNHTYIDDPTSQNQYIPQPQQESNISQDNADVLYDNAKKMYKYKQFEDALISINSCLDISPNNTDYWNLRGVILANMQKYEEALLSFDKALEFNRNDPTINNNKKLCLKKMQTKK